MSQRYEDVVERILRQVGGTNVEAIFGESRQIGEKVVIPVGRISYGWGAGGGKGGPMKKEEGAAEAEGEGMGAGMGVKVTPMGFITVTADRVAYEPIYDYGAIITVAGVILGLTVLKAFKFMGMAKSRKFWMMKHMKYPGHTKHMKHGE